MQTSVVIHTLESAVEGQLALSNDPGLESAGRALLAALRPAVREAAFDLAGQAAEEVRAQLWAGFQVDLILVDGEPTIRITSEEPAVTTPEEEFDARITLRLPPSIKEIVEQAASAAGDSVNSWVVKALAGKATTIRPHRRRVNETFEL